MNLGWAPFGGLLPLACSPALRSPGKPHVAHVGTAGGTESHCLRRSQGLGSLSVRNKVSLS